jgi:phage tail-like protein
MAGKTVERFDDPYGGHYFALEINGQQIAHFLECSGLKSTSAVFEIEEGGVNGLTHKRPGQSKWENIVLRYATSASFELLAWRDKFLNDQFSYKGQENTGAIILYDNSHNEVRRFSFKNAWPVSWEGPSLNAGSSELAVETLEISHEGLTVSAGSR